MKKVYWTLHEVSEKQLKRRDTIVLVETVTILCTSLPVYIKFNKNGFLLNKINEENPVRERVLLMIILKYPQDTAPQKKYNNKSNRIRHRSL